MVLPFRRKGSGKDDDEPVDQDIEDIMNEAEGLSEEEEPVVQEPVEEETGDELDLKEKMAKSARTVIDTCMDLRRGENILIVCDSTTTEVGQALHDAASLRSDRVLLVVMPKGRHHGEEPPTPVANLMRQQQVVIAPTLFADPHPRRSSSHQGRFPRGDHAGHDGGNVHRRRYVG